MYFNNKNIDVMIMVKFDNKNVSSRLGIKFFDTPRSTLRKLFHRVNRQDSPNYSSIAITTYSEVHDAVLRAEYQKSLGFQYLETRKLTLV
jgi:hypothetical protein